MQEIQAAEQRNNQGFGFWLWVGVIFLPVIFIFKVCLGYKKYKHWQIVFAGIWTAWWVFFNFFMQENKSNDVAVKEPVVVSDFKKTEESSLPASSEAAVAQDSDNKKDEEVKNWEYSESNDKMRNEVAKFAETISTNEIDFGFPYDKQKLYLLIRKRNGITDIYITMENGNMICGFDGCNYAVKFDDGEIQNYRMSQAEASLNKTIFFENDSVFAQIKKHKKMVLEIKFFDHGAAQYEFDIQNLDPNFM